jgi:hypothetical protein
MYAENAEVPTPCGDVIIADQARVTIQDINSIKSPFMQHVPTWERLLKDYSDKSFIIDGIINGVNIGYKGPRQFRVDKNWPSTYKNIKAVTDNIETDLRRGRMLGPYVMAPYKNFVGSPMGAFEKKRSSGKFRVIHDLSWPPGRSINDHIAREDFALNYITIGHIVQSVKKCGSSAFIAKIDLADAFKQILVRPQDWELLGMSLEKTDQYGRIYTSYYVQTVLCFGLRSAPFLFNKYADALQHAMTVNNVTNICHFLDDYITWGTDVLSCTHNLDRMLATCRSMGFEVQPTKTVTPSTCVEVLGIVIDTKLLQLRISGERLSQILIELNSWKNKTSSTKRKLLSIIGKLVFISAVVRCGKTFTRRLIELSKTVQFLHHHVRINKAARLDIQWWSEYLPTWNGISYFTDEHWTHNMTINLWTDSSDLGMGATFQTAWLMEDHRDDAAWLKRPIVWRELYAVVIAAATWASKMRGKKIMYFCDNIAVVHILRSGVSKDVHLMELVRELFFIAADFGFEWSSEYLNTMSNGVADALSRIELDRFRNLTTDMDMYMTKPAKIKCAI